MYVKSALQFFLALSFSLAAVNSSAASNVASQATRHCQLLAKTIGREFEAYCVDCHGGANRAGGLGDIQGLDALINEGYIIPFNSGNSLVYQRVASGTMPPSYYSRAPESLSTTLRQWIDCGAHTPTTPDQTHTFISNEYVYQTIAQDLATLPQPNRKNTRYLNFVNLFNLTKSEATIESYRQAANFLLNSLSSSSRSGNISQWIDEERLILRFSIKDMDWSPEQIQALEAAYPYEVKDYHINERYPAENQRLVNEIRSEIGSEQFIFLADWFITASSQTPLYELLANIPQTLEELDQDQGLEMFEPVEWTNALRFGKLSSMFSGGPGITENRDIYYGSQAWIWYDFNGASEEEFFGHLLSIDASNIKVMYSRANGFMTFASYDRFGNYIPFTYENELFDAEETPREYNRHCIDCHKIPVLSADTDVTVKLIIENAEAIPPWILDVFGQNEDLRALADNTTNLVQQAYLRSDIDVRSVGQFTHIYREFSAPVDIMGLAAILGIPPKDLKNRMALHRDKLPAPFRDVYYGESMDRGTLDSLFVAFTNSIGFGIGKH